MLRRKRKAEEVELPPVEFTADDPVGAPSALVFQFLGAIFLIIALVTHAVHRNNPSPEVAPS